MEKNSNFKTIFMAFLLLIMSSISVAGTVEKLAEYSAFEVLADISSGGQTTVFNGHPYLVKLEKNNDKLHLVTTTLVNNYSDIAHYVFALEGLVAANAEYEISVASNQEDLFVLLTNYQDNVRNNKSLLLKSSDGKNWKLYKTFPSEWDLDDSLAIVGDNISINCNNCEDTYRVTPVISNDKGKSWQKHSLPEAVSYPAFSGIANNRLFALMESRDSENRAFTTFELQYKDLKTPNSSWVKTNIKHLVQINAPTKLVQSDDQDKNVLNLVEITEIFDIADYLVANVKYQTESGDYQYFAWISNDNGDNWEFLNFDLNDGMIMQFAKHHDNYHVVTAKKSELAVSWDSQSEDFILNLPKIYKSKNLHQAQDPINLLEAILSYFADQKYSYFTLSQEQLSNRSKANTQLSPKFTFDGAVGYNLNYVSNPKTTYVDTMLIRNSGESLSLEFYRLRD